MSRHKKQTAIFFTPPGSFQRLPVNRAARREIDAMRRKALVDPAQYTKRPTRGRSSDREPLELVKSRRRVAAEWRSMRRSKEQGLMRAR